MYINICIYIQIYIYNTPAPTADSVAFSYFLPNFWGETDNVPLKFERFQAKSLAMNPCNEWKRTIF